MTQARTDLADVVIAAHEMLERGIGADWAAPAADLDWTCWETIEHVCDDLFAYAGQLSAPSPPQDTYVRMDFRAKREGGPRSTIFAEQGATNAQLVEIFDTCAGLLDAVVAVAPPSRRGWHPDGLSDPDGFAAMAVVEVLVHLHDVTRSLGEPWDPDRDICARVLDRLFPEAPRGEDPWATLLWATGRSSLGPRERLEEWRWDANVRGA